MTDAPHGVYGEGFAHRRDKYCRNCDAFYWADECPNCKPEEQVACKNCGHMMDKDFSEMTELDGYCCIECQDGAEIDEPTNQSPCDKCKRLEQEVYAYMREDETIPLEFVLRTDNGEKSLVTAMKELLAEKNAEIKKLKGENDGN